MAEFFKKYRFSPDYSFKGNPHRGIATNQCYNGDPLLQPGQLRDEHADNAFVPFLTPAGYFPSSVAYFRWHWREVEPIEGQFDFSCADRALEMCKRRGQTLGVRLVVYSSAANGFLPDWYVEKYPCEPANPANPDFRHPAHESPEFVAKFCTLLREFGARYDAHPLLESIDIAYLGPAGSGTGFGGYPLELCEKFAQAWQEAFPQTFRLAQTADPQLRTAVATGAGFRMDGFGDLRENGSSEVSKKISWNHMYDAYPREIIEGQAAEVWKRAPVTIESLYFPAYWFDRDFDIDFLLEQAEKYHPTIFNPKSAPLPEKWRDKLDVFCRKLGYRFVYRQVWYEARVKAGASFRFQSWIENTGLAPIYYPYEFALRLRQEDREAILVLDGIDPRTWLPGDVWLDRVIPMPAEMKPGLADLSAGLIDPETHQAAVCFDIKENFSDRWASLGQVEIV